MEAARKQWGQPQMTQIISALGNAKLQTATTTIGPDEPDAAKKAQLPVVTQSSGSTDSSTMGTTVTVQSPTTPALLGVTVVRSPTSESPKTVIVRKDRVEENSQAGSTITISAETPDAAKKPVTLETISEGTKEGDKEDATVKAVDAEVLNIEDVEDITVEKAESEAGEKAEPKSPVKAWGEVKASAPTESRLLKFNHVERFSTAFTANGKRHICVYVPQRISKYTRIVQNNSGLWC